MRRSPAASGSAAVAAFGIVLCLASAPLASATGAVRLGVNGPPYHLAHVSISKSLTSGTCSAASIHQPPHFNPKSGTGGFNISTSATSCSNIPHGGQLNGYAEADVFVEIPAMFPGTHRNFSLSFTLSATATTAIHLKGTCPFAGVPASGYSSEFCYVSAQAIVIVDAELLNASGVILTGGASAFPIDNYSIWENSSSCVATGNCSYYNYTSPASVASFSGTTTFQLNFTPPPRALKGQGPHYLLWLHVFGQATAAVDCSPSLGMIGTTVSTQLDLGTRAHGFKLTSIAVS